MHRLIEVENSILDHWSDEHSLIELIELTDDFRWFENDDRNLLFEAYGLTNIEHSYDEHPEMILWYFDLARYLETAQQLSTLG